MGAAGLLAAIPAVLPAMAEEPENSGAPLVRAAGVAVLDGRPKALCRVDSRWVLVGLDGVTAATTGLEGANIVDMSGGRNGVLAAGSRRAGEITEAAVWQSADGRDWREVVRLTGINSEYTAVGFDSRSAMALGSTLTIEGAPKSTIAARRSAFRWTTVPVTGLETTDQQAIVMVSGTPSGWLTAAVTQDGTTFAQSADGFAWTALGDVAEVAVQGVRVASNGAIRWMGNAISGAAAIAGTVGAGHASVAVGQDAQAVGTVRGSGYWLVDGRLVAAEI
jgi:hypothetical protein